MTHFTKVPERICLFWLGVHWLHLRNGLSEQWLQAVPCNLYALSLSCPVLELQHWRMLPTKEDIMNQTIDKTMPICYCTAKCAWPSYEKVNTSLLVFGNSSASSITPHLKMLVLTVIHVLPAGFTCVCPWWLHLRNSALQFKDFDSATTPWCPS